MKFEFLVVATALVLCTSFVCRETQADESVAPGQKKAEASMLKACGKEFPEQVKNWSLDQVDQWAEAKENGSDSATFKKSKCFARHEAWEKLAQKNEWAITNPPSNPARLPAATQH